MKINKNFLFALAQRTGPAFISFVFFLILARLMGPPEFGLLAQARFDEKLVNVEMERYFLNALGTS